MKTYNTIIGGKQITAKNTFEVKNPATEELIGHAPISTKTEVEQAVNAAKKAQPSWAALEDDVRKDYIMKVADVLSNNTEILARWITKEQGKPLAGPGSMFEMEACVGWTQVPASLDLPVEVVFEDDTRRDELHRKPIGVVAAIAPWNWPLMIAIWQIIPAIRAGNTVVLKPSEYTTIGTLEMVRLINEVLPAGVLNTVSGPGEIGAELVANKDVGKVMFTGSNSTGEKIIKATAGNMTRLTLELGGNDAAIIMEDINAEAIAEGLFWGSFLNMGQTCACAKRLYVHESKYEEVISVLSDLAQKMPMGNGLDEGVVLGPIQNKMQYDKVVDLVEDAKANNARIVCGGSAKEGKGFFYPITIIADVTDGTRIVDEEQFGPVLPIIKYSNIEEAIKSANRLEAGLGASVWSSNIDEAKKVAARVEAGTVWINQHGAIHPMVPFGGIKGSGYGVEFGVDGLKSVTQPQVISINKA
ncbi:aldehyde dehydrogenase family protein [Lacinutrix sp. 5H-3-7-4]|uniref:aldehyde dehydrogenase family protein n=1 Tax=Lacinutrix sp. (strain 5H-3-7-4) TaxID=983544 RepID=UPI00020A3E0F|nr:aldehyde dehydrogenase family protein [Lacinutrix sp. 5H-3-7-4]AEH01472.1 Aldehyde Dehydrogenase [Lacinutrix sp. 5H-3-7-4]